MEAAAPRDAEAGLDEKDSGDEEVEVRSEVLAPPCLDGQVAGGALFGLGAWYLVRRMLGPSLFAASPWVRMGAVAVGVILGLGLVGHSHSALAPPDRLPALAGVVFLSAGGVQALLIAFFGGSVGPATFWSAARFALAAAVVASFAFSMHCHYRWWRVLCFESALGACYESATARHLWQLEFSNFIGGQKFGEHVRLQREVFQEFNNPGELGAPNYRSLNTRGRKQTKRAWET